MESFWGSDVWGAFDLVAVLLLSLIVANILKRRVKFLKSSLIPTSVLGGILLLLVAGIFDLINGGGETKLFTSEFFGGNGYATLEIITYHALALGFIASTMKASDGKLGRQRTVEIFNTGVTTVSTYLLQAIVGFGITILVALFVKDFFPAAGILLPFGYGQGTGQALNYGSIYEGLGFVDGKSFGLTIAAFGFLSASIGGVMHLTILKKKNKIVIIPEDERPSITEQVEGENEIPMQGSMDKMTVQVAFVAGAYLLAYLFMFLLSLLLPGMKAVIYGFNFLLGVLTATLVKSVLNFMYRKKIINHKYINDFLMTRVSNICFDVMVVAGIAAIRIGALGRYLPILLVLGVVGLFITYWYNRFVAKKLFPHYAEEQFLMMYGMLTGTASTGIILLREIDGEFKTPAADNMVYQNFPAIVFGFPMMLLATLAPQNPKLTMIILVLFFIAMNVLLFRSFIFKKKKK